LHVHYEPRDTPHAVSMLANIHDVRLADAHDFRVANTHDFRLANTHDFRLANTLDFRVQAPKEASHGPRGAAGFGVWGSGVLGF